MNAAQLKEAGFSDDEIRSWLSSKHAELKAAGFNDAEIEAKYGPTPASPPEPPPFDLEKHFRDPDQAPPEFAGLDAGDVLIGSPGGASRNQDDLVLSEVLHDNFVKPWLAVGYTGEAALNRGSPTSRTIWIRSPNTSRRKRAWSAAGFLLRPRRSTTQTASFGRNGPTRSA